MITASQMRDYRASLQLAKRVEHLKKVNLTVTSIIENIHVHVTAFPESESYTYDAEGELSGIMDKDVKDTLVALGYKIKYGNNGKYGISF